MEHGPRARTHRPELSGQGRCAHLALEAGTRTGIDLGDAARLLQPFVIETSRQGGILYIAVVDDEGRILAHSDPQEVGDALPLEQLPAAEPSKTIAWRGVRSSRGDAFEVYREFSPAPGYHHTPMGMHGRMRGHGGMMGRMSMPMPMPGPARQELPRSFAMIGFDKKPYDALFAQARFSSLMITSVAALLGLGSFVSLFWAHNYRRSRRLLKDTRALASEVVTNLPVGLITCEPDGTVGMINDAALTMLRTDRERVAGASIHAVPGLNWGELTAALARNDKVIEREAELVPDQTGHGAATPVSLSAAQIRDEDGLFLGHLFILRDISAMKRLEAEARRNDRLAALGSLAAGVAHEIRNPLSSIKGLATFLAGRVRDSAPEEEAAKTMIAEVERLNRVVSQLLEFARPGAMKRVDTDIRAVIARALRLAEADLRAKNISVAFAGDEPGPSIPLNAERFTQALLNLFLNAIQAMEPGGKLEIDVSLQDDGAVCRVGIRDNGKGMPPEILSSIFTPYFTTRASGTGLGLAIVHQIIEGHDGRIVVTSTPGAGSEFTLLLPVRTPSHSEQGH